MFFFSVPDMTFCDERCKLDSYSIDKGGYCVVGIYLVKEKMLCLSSCQTKLMDKKALGGQEKGAVDEAKYLALL